MTDPDLLEGDALFGRRNYAEALERYRRAADLAAGVEALAQVARCYSALGKLEEGRPWLERAEKLASADEPQGWSRLLGVRGIFLREAGDKAGAKAAFESMYSYCLIYVAVLRRPYGRTGARGRRAPRPAFLAIVSTRFSTAAGKYFSPHEGHIPTGTSCTTISRPRTRKVSVRVTSIKRPSQNSHASPFRLFFFDLINRYDLESAHRGDPSGHP